MGPVELRRALVRRVVVASVTATATFVGYYQLLGDLPEGRTRVSIVAQNIVLSSIGITLLAVLTDRFIRRNFEPSWRWLAEGRAPDADERSAVVRQPSYLVAFVVVSWIAAALFSAGDDAIDGRYKAAVAEFVGIMLGTLANGALVYLLTERLLKPVFAPALAGGIDRPTTAGIRPRLLVVWALGSGVPLLGVVVTPLIDRGGPFPPSVAMVYLGVIGLVLGFLMTRVVARSIAEPIAQVRDRVQRLQAGDVDVTLPVDDAGEVGMLQSGFNEMVAGLRERRVLEDLIGRHVGVEVAQQAVERGVALGGELPRSRCSLSI